MGGWLSPVTSQPALTGELNWQCSLSHRYKGSDTEELFEMLGDQDLKEACKNLEEGFRLTLWAYDKEESEVLWIGLKHHVDHYLIVWYIFLNHQPVLKEVMAISEYSAQYDDELTFRKGDRLQVYKEGMFFYSVAQFRACCKTCHSCMAVLSFATS